MFKIQKRSFVKYFLIVNKANTRDILLKQFSIFKQTQNIFVKLTHVNAVNFVLTIASAVYNMFLKITMLHYNKQITTQNNVFNNYLNIQKAVSQ